MRFRRIGILVTAGLGCLLNSPGFAQQAPRFQELDPSVGIRAAVLVEALRRGQQQDLQDRVGDAELNYVLTYAGNLLREARVPAQREKEQAGFKLARQGLANLWLVRHEEEFRDAARARDAIRTLSTPSRMLLGDYLSERRDPRCVPFYEACYQEWEQKNTDPATGEVRKVKDVVPGVHPLAWYYQAIGDWQKAADTYMLSEKYSTAPAWVGAAMVEAARAYGKVGDSTASQEAYAKAAQSGDGWAAGMVLYDQANVLIANGQHAEARRLLQSAVQGPYARQMQIAFASLLANSYYQNGETELAKKTAQDALSLAQGVTLKQKEGLESQIEAARSLLAGLERREKQPLSVDTKEVRFRVRSGERAPRQWLTVTSADPEAPTVENSDARLRVEVKKQSRQGAQVLHYVAVQVVTQNVTQSFDTQVLLRLGKHESVPVRVWVQVDGE